MKAAKQPCGSCPYRLDVPAGIWEAHEYEKLPAYDGSIVDQVEANAFGIFMCHQRDGNLCAGWLACHGPHELLAMRLAREPVPESIWNYRTDVPVFASGVEAAAHGISGIEQPDARAKRMMAGIIRKREKTQ